MKTHCDQITTLFRETYSVAHFSKIIKFKFTFIVIVFKVLFIYIYYEKNTLYKMVSNKRKYIY